MKITGVHVWPMNDVEQKLAGFASATFDHCLVVRDIRIVHYQRESEKEFFLAMPSRPAQTVCRCGRKNTSWARFCNWCGRGLSDHDKGNRSFFDVTFPCSSWLRKHMEVYIFEAYNMCIAKGSAEVRMEVSEADRQWYFDDEAAMVRDYCSPLS